VYFEISGETPDRWKLLTWKKLPVHERPDGREDNLIEDGLPRLDAESKR